MQEFKKRKRILQNATKAVKFNPGVLAERLRNALNYRSNQELHLLYKTHVNNERLGPKQLRRKLIEIWKQNTNEALCKILQLWLDAEVSRSRIHFEKREQKRQNVFKSVAIIASLSQVIQKVTKHGFFIGDTRVLWVDNIEFRGENGYLYHFYIPHEVLGLLVSILPRDIIRHLFTFVAIVFWFR
jgi:hypothetical protein